MAFICAYVANEATECAIRALRRIYSTELAIAAHMEIANPSIKETVALCVEEGCTEVIVAPYFLSQGRHIQQDIPNLVAEAQADHPDLRCIIADPIGQKCASETANAFLGLSFCRQGLSKMVFIDWHAESSARLSF